MHKKIFILIIFLMSISLIGIISVQFYWTQNAFKNNQKRFETDVTIALAKTSEIIKDLEEANFYREYKTFFQNKAYTVNSEIKNFLFQKIYPSKKQQFGFGDNILAENFKIPIHFLNKDSIMFKSFLGAEHLYHSKKTEKNKKRTDFFEILNQTKYTLSKEYSNLEKQQIKDAFLKLQLKKPIYIRIENSVLNTILKKEFLKRNIALEYQYGLYQNGLATPLKSKNYILKSKNSFSYPLFKGGHGNSDYKLFVTFPNEQRYLLSKMMSILLISTIFIFIIILVFSYSLYQLIHQKRISKMKTDFINNITHEFKTPIATINLALDSIENPKIITNQQKINQYVKIIRDENKRMNRQVQNVLNISKLQKKEIDIKKEIINAHKIIQNAIDYISSSVLDKKGIVSTHFNAKKTQILADPFHLTNVFINVLENAIKYSEDTPKIDIFTQTTNKFFILKIKDKGIGMSKNAQKYVFNKFYREYKGNIHNVKGQGLGLTYVKGIIEDHQGIVYVKSKKGKGSIFTIKLALI